MEEPNTINELAVNFRNYTETGRFVRTETEVKKLISTGFSGLLGKDRELMIAHRNSLVAVVNRFDSISIAVLISSLTDRLDEVSRRRKLLMPNVELPIDGKADVSPQTFIEYVLGYFAGSEPVRLLDSQRNQVDISVPMARGLFDVAVETIQYSSSEVFIDEQHFDFMLRVLIFAGLCNKQSTDSRWLFYKLAILLIQVLNKSERYQQARNLSEELFALSADENVIEYGLCVQYNCFARQRNVLDAVFYFVAFAEISFGRSLTTKQWIDSLMTAQSLFRDLRFPVVEEKLERNLMVEFKTELDDRAIVQVGMSTFGSKLGRGEINADEVVSFINEHREKIFAQHAESIFVWYVLIQQIRVRDTVPLLEEYGNFFEKCLSQEHVSKARQLLGQVDDFRHRYNEIYASIDETYYHRDLSSELQLHELFLHRMVAESVDRGDFAIFVNAFRLLCDSSTFLIEKEPEELIAFGARPDSEPRDYYAEYQSLFETKCTTGLELLLVGMSEDVAVSLNWASDYRGVPTRHASWTKPTQTRTLSVLPKLTMFDPRPGENQAALDEPGLKCLGMGLEAFQVPSHSDHPLGVVLSVETAAFPPNLLGNAGDFLFLKRPIFSLPGPDHLFTRGDRELDANSISLWCPSESGDVTLNLLMNSLRDSLDELKIAYNTSVELSFPNNTDIKVVIAHGGSDIDDSEILSASGAFGGETQIYRNVGEVLAGTKVVVMFVCYSGKVTEDYFYLRQNTLTKTLHSKGVEVVISPKWPLHIAVPPVWLPTFVGALRSGSSTVEAFHSASLEVHRIYRSCGAWANLHYSGIIMKASKA